MAMPPSLITVFPAGTIALGVTALLVAPSQAADSGSESYPEYDTWSYSDTRLYLPDLDHAYRQGAPAYHYAYYAIARPEYLL